MISPGTMGNYNLTPNTMFARNTKCLLSRQSLLLGGSSISPPCLQVFVNVSENDEDDHEDDNDDADDDADNDVDCNDDEYKDGGNDGLERVFFSAFFYQIIILPRYKIEVMFAPD